MKPALDQALQQAITAHKEGKLQEAERLYRAILQKKPNNPDANHNLGVLVVAAGKPLEALPFLKKALDTNPEVEQFWLSYIDALVKSGHFDEAQRLIEDSKKNGVAIEKLKVLSERVQKTSLKIEPPQTQLDALLDHYQNCRFDDAEALAKSLTEEFPAHQFGWKVLGAVFKNTNRVGESLGPLQKSVKLAPRDAEAHNNLGVTLKDLGRFNEAEDSFRAAVAFNSNYAEAYNNLGTTLRGQSRLAEAEVSLNRAIALKSDYAEAYNNLANTLKDMGRLEDAEVRYKKALDIKPDFAPARNNLATTLKGLGRLEEAEESLRQAIALSPNFAQSYNNLGVVLRRLGRNTEAVVALRYAMSLEPGLPEAHSNLGGALQELGSLEEAEASYTKALALKPDFAEVHRYLTTLKSYVSQDEHLSQMRELYANRSLSQEDRCHICFGLAKASDDLADFAAAFQYYAEGNALRKRLSGYEKSTDVELFQRFEASHVGICEHSLQLQDTTVDLVPIFVVGMPRSGTTLVEQIASSHSLVTGAGELPFVAKYGAKVVTMSPTKMGESLRHFREQYLEALRAHSDYNTYVIDKMPLNFRFLGLIAAAFPEAKIIHVHRDPAAVCWANYVAYFHSDTLGYSSSLDDIVSYYRLYRNLMKYWQASLPGRIYDLSYESLTVNQEEETRKLIEYLDLTWEDICMSPQDNKRAVATASNLQVRKKVYQGSSERWKRYGPYLNGVLDHLGDDKDDPANTPKSWT